MNGQDRQAEPELNGEATEKPAHERLENLASHLRTIHFSLLVVSLACLVAVSVEVPFEIRAAVDSLDRLRRLENEDPGRWLAEAIGPQRFQEGLPPDQRVVHVYPDYDLMLETVGTITSIEMLCELPELIVSTGPDGLDQDAFFFYANSPTGEDGELQAGVGRGVLEPVRRPRQVQELWDALGATANTVYVPKAYRVIQPDKFLRAASQDGSGAHGPLIRFPIDFEPCADSPMVRSKSARQVTLSGCWRDRTGTLFEVELVLEKHAELLTPKLAEYLSVPSVAAGFAQAFPALNARMVGRSAEDFEVLDTALRGAQELAQREQALELFGADVPVSHLTLWGSIVVLALQLYFLSHVRQLQRASLRDSTDSLSKSPPLVPWIVIYRGRIAGLISYGSICVLPTAVVGILSWRTAETGGMASLGVAAAIASLALTLTCWLVLLRIRRPVAKAE